MSGRRRSSQAVGADGVDRTLPELSKHIYEDLPSHTASTPNGNAMGNGDHGRNGVSSYESALDLNKITRRQLEEDIQAYRYDLDFCKQQIYAPDLTSQEARVIQLRILDMGHQIRHCQHRIELIDAQSRGNTSVKRPMFTYDGAPKRQSTDPQGGNAPKRPRPAKAGESDGDDATIEVDVTLGERSVTRLGFWKCHLCTSHKFLSAGSNRVPSAPCKWPLKDISKMLNHFLDMHTEHTAEERCMELGDALDQNRGPFEYWLSRTRHQNLGDGSLVDECIDTLKAGAMPDSLRNLNRAAANFPNGGPKQENETSEY